MAETWTKETLCEYLNKRIPSDFIQKVPQTYEITSEEDDEDNQEHSSKQTKEKKNVFCINCKGYEVKYKCPGCHEPFCSSSCLKEHKDLLKCANNKRAQAFVKKKEYSERNLLRDFNYLSDIIENYDKSKKRLSMIEGSLSKHQEMVRYKILAENAKTKNIKVDFAPRFMQRHRENISFYFTKDKLLYWVFEINLVLFSSSKEKEVRKGFQSKSVEIETIRHITQPVSEEATFFSLLQSFPWVDNKVLVALGSNIAPQLKACSDSQPSKDRPLQTLTDLTEVSPLSAPIKIFIKNRYDLEKCREDAEMDMGIKEQILLGEDSGNGCKFVQIDGNKPICKVIRNMDIHEFPTIYLVKDSDEVLLKIHL